MKRIMLRVGLTIASLLVAVAITYTPTSELRKELANTAWAKEIGTAPSYFFNEDASEVRMGSLEGMGLYKIFYGEFRLISYSKEGVIYNLGTEVKMRLEEDKLIITHHSSGGKSYEHVYYQAETD